VAILVEPISIAVMILFGIPLFVNIY
jgi:hypothetical protein